MQKFLEFFYHLKWWILRISVVGKIGEFFNQTLGKIRGMESPPFPLKNPIM